MNIYKQLFKYIPESRSKAVMAILLSFVSAFLTSVGYYYVFHVLSSLLVTKDMMGAQVWAIWTMVFLTLGGLLYYGSGVLSHVVAFRLETNLRKHGIDGLTNASFRFFDTHSSGVIRKTIDDNAVMTHTAVAHMIPDLGQAILTPILMIIFGFIISWKVGIAIIIFVILGGVFMNKMMGGETQFIAIYQEALKRMSGETVEYVRGIKVIKLFKTEINAFKALHDAIMDYAKGAYDYSKSCKFPYVTYQWIFLGAIPILVLGLSFYLGAIANPTLMMIDMIMFFFLLGVIFVSIMRIMYFGQHIYNANYAIQNLETFYDAMHADKLEFGAHKTFDNYNIAFEHVDFSYGEHKVFENFNLSLEAGKSYALVGASGSGKSTIAKLLSGFYKVNGGMIKIGEYAINDYTEEAIIEAISYVFQDPKLFKQSLYDNVAIANPKASRETVMEALHLAGCDDILDKFPQRENTLIGTKGVYLSGGEKQRIAIARAIVKGSPILVMDEASAAIDADNEYKLQEAFKNLMKGKTVIMIAHRLSSIQNVDEIIVLKDGHVVERGNHQALLAQKGEYEKVLELYNSANDWRLSDEGAF